MKYFFGLVILLLLAVIDNTKAIKIHPSKQNIIAEFQLHNLFRILHGVQPLKLDQAINLMAQKYAEKLANTKTLQPSGVSGYGENLYRASSKYYGGQATQTWYKEINLYNYQNPGFSKSTDHFTQVVWKSSIYVGFGQKDGYVVANYRPSGNQLGKFPQNVLPKK